MSYNNPKVSCTEVEQYMSNGPAVVTTTDVADHFEVSHVTARKRLTELADTNRIANRELHTTMVVWWLPEKK